MSTVTSRGTPSGPIATWPRVAYSDLNAKQKEIFNFQKVAALLADYGFNCIKLADDWQGTDFLAYHYHGEQTLKVQLKAGLEIHKKYQGRDLHMAFRVNALWYLIEHDALVKLCAKHTTYLTTKEWREKHWYYTAGPNANLVEALNPYLIESHL